MCSAPPPLCRRHRAAFAALPPPPPSSHRCHAERLQGAATAIPPLSSCRHCSQPPPTPPAATAATIVDGVDDLRIIQVRRRRRAGCRDLAFVRRRTDDVRVRPVGLAREERVKRGSEGEREKARAKRKREREDEEEQGVRVSKGGETRRVREEEEGERPTAPAGAERTMRRDGPTPDTARTSKTHRTRPDPRTHATVSAAAAALPAG